MRIHLNLKPTSSNSGSTTNHANLPESIVRLIPSNELVLIELQGALDIEDLDPMGGQQLGRLTFEKGREDKPTLLISHHRLEGRIVNLIKPLAVLEKRRRDESKEENENEIHQQDSNFQVKKKAIQIDSSPIGMRGNQNERKRNLGNFQEGEEEEEEAEEEMEELDENQSSPTNFGKKPNFNSKKPKISEAKGKEKEKAKEIEMEGLELETPSKSRLKRKDQDSSSPMPLPIKRGEALDFSSPQSIRKNNSNIRLQLSNKNEDEEKNEEKNDDEEDDIKDEISLKPTSTSYDMICIIRKKILFDKRPEPVVRLEGAEGLKVAKTLGIKTR